MRVLRSYIVGILARIFRTVRMPPSLEPVLKEPLHFVLVTQSDSIIVEGLLSSFATRSGLSGCVHLSHLTARPRQAAIHWTSLHRYGELVNFLRRYPDIKLCTVNIFKVRGPVRHSPQNRPSFFSLMGLVLARRLAFVLIGSPIARPPLSPVRLLRCLRVDFYRNLKLVRGTPFPPLEAQMRTILSGAEFESESKILADRAGVSVFEMKDNARKAFLELAANPRRFMLRIISIVARFSVKRLFSEVVTSGLDRLIPAIKSDTVVLVPMHRSHLDYVLIGHILYQSNVNPPLVAAGMNLAFWPAGFFLRSAGAYFVKRNARDRLHALLLRRYVTYLIKRGHMQEFFIEGGRSRSGRMLQPKYGLLNTILEAWRKKIRREILFVPVAISYENVIEDAAFGEENTGKSKQKETALALLGSLDIFTRKYGEAIVNFGPPLSLSTFAAECGYSVDSKKRRGEDGSFVERLGTTLTRAIRDQVSPTLTSLAYTAFMMSPAYALSFEKLAAEVRRLAQLALELRTINPSLGELSPALKRFLQGNDTLLRDLARDAMKQIWIGTQEIYYVPGQRRFTADFYRNATIHLFFPIAVLSLLELLKDGLSEQHIATLHRLLCYDFILPPREQFLSELKLVADMLKERRLMNDSSAGLKLEPGARMPGLLLSSLETHRWVRENILWAKEVHYTGNSQREIKRAVCHGELMRALKENFKAAGYLGLVSRTEAASNSSLVSALESLENQNLVSCVDDSGPREIVLVHSDFAEDLAFLKRLIGLVLAEFRSEQHEFQAAISQVSGPKSTVMPGA